eukprot:gene18380-16385_t
MAWSDAGFTVKSLNASALPTGRISAIKRRSGSPIGGRNDPPPHFNARRRSLLGSAEPVKWSQDAAGLHIAPMRRPPGGGYTVNPGSCKDSWR